MPSTDLDAWLATELAKLYAQEPKDEPGILLGAAVWGEKYVDRLVRFCLPSLVTPANMAALQAMNAKIMLVTTTGDFVGLWRKIAPFERAGLRFEMHYFPRELIAEPPGRLSHKFELLGTLQNLMIAKAARTGMGFHMLMPDHLYSERYFDVVMGWVGEHEAVAHGAVSANIEAAVADIDGFRQGRALCIPARALGDIGRRHLHRQTRAVILNGVDDDRLPQSNVMFWMGKDAMHIAGPFGNPAWLGPRLCRSAPVVAPTSLDAELPNLMPHGFHQPGPDDDMVCVELSDDGKGAPKPGDGPDDFISINWMQMNFDNVYVPLLRRRTLIPTETHADGMEDADIERHHAALVEMIMNGKTEAMERFCRYLRTINRRLLRDLPMGL